LQKVLVDDVAQRLVGQAPFLLIDVLGNVGSAAKLLGLGIQRARRRPNLTQKLRRGDVVRTDAGHDLVCSNDVVVENPAEEYPTHDDYQRADGDIQSVLLVLFALPL
jgi:hypothetical protein